MNLFEKLNRLDDSLVESKIVVKKKKLIESVEDEYEAFCEDELDDETDEMLTESSEQYELSTLVKDSINHLVNNLGKDSMADDFGDDVCADLEDNYDIDVPQNPVKYADWCDAVMCEIYRQLNREELAEGNNVSSQLTPAIDSFLQDIAQMYETIDYKDIIEHNYSEEDIKKLKILRRVFREEVMYEGDEEANITLENIAKEVARIVKGNDRIVESENTDDTTKQETIDNIEIYEPTNVKHELIKVTKNWTFEGMLKCDTLEEMKMAEEILRRHYKVILPLDFAKSIFVDESIHKH